MNIFSNIGITEVIVILLLALLVVGPERLPELGRKLGETLRDLRKAYENLTRDLGPELASIQQTAQELRESVESVTSIPQDMTQKVIESTGLEDTVGELKEMQATVGQVGATLTSAGKMVRDPVGQTVSTAREALLPSKPRDEQEETVAESQGSEPVPEQQGTSEGMAASAESKAAAEEEPRADNQKETAAPLTGMDSGIATKALPATDTPAEEKTEGTEPVPTQNEAATAEEQTNE